MGPGTSSNLANWPLLIASKEIPDDLPLNIITPLQIQNGDPASNEVILNE